MKNNGYVDVPVKLNLEEYSANQSLSNYHNND